jgi:hypothetical protein
MRELIRRLADREPVDAPVLSIYLDMRPQETAPTIRPGLLFLEERLRAIEKTLWPRGIAYDSVRADAVSIARHLDDNVPAGTQGVALFTCAAVGLFEAVAVGVTFENQVVAAPAPDLFQLARLLDDQETAVVAVVDTNTARIFVTRMGHLDEVGGPDDKNTKYYRKVSLGGLNESRYQRHANERRAEFAREAAVELERVVVEESAVRVILAGDEVALPLLRGALSSRVTALLHEEVLRFDIRAPRDEVKAAIAPLLAQAEAEDAHSLADQLIHAVQTSGLGVVGADPTRIALEYGQGDVLLLSPEAEVDEEARRELIRLATTTGAGVEVVEKHDLFQQLGGVGALLRYRHAAPEPATP